MQSANIRVRPWSFECLVEWLKIREQEGRSFPQDVQAFVLELDHSALLQRLVSGKQPLPTAPPLSFAYPWYDLIEDGKAEPVEVWVGDKIANERHNARIIVINQSIWKIIEQFDEAEFVVTHDEGKTRYLLSRIERDGGRVWQLERLAQNGHPAASNR